MDANCIFRCQLTAHSAATAKWYLNIYKDSYKMNNVEQFVLQLLREFMYPVEFNVSDNRSICKDCAQLLPSMLAHITEIRNKQSYIMEAFQDAGLINNDDIEIDVHSPSQQLNSDIVEIDPSNNSIERKLEMLMSEFVRVSCDLALQQNHDIIDLTIEPKTDITVKSEPVHYEHQVSVDNADRSPGRLATNPLPDTNPLPLSDTNPPLLVDTNHQPSLDDNLPTSFDNTPKSIHYNHLPPFDNNAPTSIHCNHLPSNSNPPIILKVTSVISEEDTEAANILLNLADQSSQFEPQTPDTPFDSLYNVTTLPVEETEQRIIGKETEHDSAPLDPTQKLDFENCLDDMEGMEGLDCDLIIAEDCDLENVQPDNSQSQPPIKEQDSDHKALTDQPQNSQDPSEPIIPSILVVKPTAVPIVKKPITPEKSKPRTPVINLPKPIFIENTSKHNNKAFSCDMCTFKTKHRSSLKRHIHIHTGNKPKPHTCTVCNYRTGNKAHLEVHMRLHTGHKPYKCTLCDFTAMQKSNLQRHAKTHSGTKPHPCPLCSFRAASKSDLLIHSRTHSGEKPFMCDLCSYRGPSSSTLATHKRKHSDYRPYSCNDCDYTTKFTGSLKLHQRTHSGNKPFHCTKCDYKAVQKSKVNRHMTQVHK